MGLFYAYLKHFSDRGECGFLIAFANREVADEWWRLISTFPSPYYEIVERISPQLYIQNRHNSGTVLFASNTILPGAEHFYKRMFVTALGPVHERRSAITIPSVTITDHVSGRWYLIRSKADPSSHWYLRIHGACLVCGEMGCDAIHVSSEYRTKFCVRVRDPPDDSQEPKDFIMIGKDEILITARKDYTLHLDNAGDLKATKGYQGEMDLLFDDLQNRFIIHSEKKVNGEVWEYVEAVEKGSGEVWELAD